MPCCPVEFNDTADATWKEWRPRIEKDGKSYQEELVKCIDVWSEMVLAVPQILLIALSERP